MSHYPPSRLSASQRAPFLKLSSSSPLPSTLRFSSPEFTRIVLITLFNSAWFSFHFSFFQLHPLSGSCDRLCCPLNSVSDLALWVPGGEVDRVATGGEIVTIVALPPAHSRDFCLRHRRKCRCTVYAPSLHQLASTRTQQKVRLKSGVLKQTVRLVVGSQHEILNSEVPQCECFKASTDHVASPRPPV